MQSLLLKAKGLFTYPNNLSEVPEGALTTADNVIVDRNGVIEPRRGFAQYGDNFDLSTDRADQLLTYKNRILRHYRNLILDFDDGNGNFTAFDGEYQETETDLRLKYIEANGNLYFTTLTGIKRISASNASQFTSAPGYIRNAGGVEALDVTGNVDYTNAGFFTEQSKVAYKITWAFKDANNNLVEGVPSSRLVLTNYSTTDSGTVDLSFAIPSQIEENDTQFFYRVYRTQVLQAVPPLVTLDEIDPGEEMNLVIEDYPTAQDLIDRSITIEDVTPDDFRQGGSLLYNNPVSGEGILQSNYPPPLAKDIALFQNSVFYANTQTNQQANLSFLSVSQLISLVSSLTITQGSTVNTYIFRGQPETTRFTFDTQANTNDGGYFLINSSSNARNYFVWFGKVGVHEITEFTFDTVANTTDGSYFLINSASDATQYFVWFDKTGSTSAPAGVDTVGKTGLRVPLVGLTTASQVATAVSNVLPISNFFTSLNVGNLTVTNQVNGATTDASTGLVVPGGAFLITPLQQGVDSTVEPSAADTVGRLPLFADIGSAITADDVAQIASDVLNSVTDFSAVATTNTVDVDTTNNGNTDDALDGLSPVGGTFSITIIQQGTGEGQDESTDFTFDTKTNTTDGGYFLLNSAQDINKYFIWMNVSGSTTAPSGIDTLGRIGIEVDLSSGAIITADDVALAVQTEIDTLPVFVTSLNANILTVTNALFGPTDDAIDGLVPLGGAFAINIVDQGENYVLLSDSASPSQAIDETARSLVNLINNNPAEVVNAFYLSGPDDVPGLILLKTRDISTGAFTLTVDSNQTGSQFNPIIPTSGITVISTNEVEPNAIYYSKFQQPEAVPIVNKFNVGPKDKAILRILALRDSLFVLKEDGIYRITGQNAQFILSPFDSTTFIIAPDSAVVLNNQIYMLSSQGVVAVSDTGVSVISRPIENILDRITSENFDYRLTTFGVAYESDRAYLLWVVTNINDTVATQCFRFNTFTTSWTRFPISKTCGVVKFDDDKMYLGAADKNFIEQERKDFIRTDYADRQYDLQIPVNSINGTEVTLSSSSDVQVGDVLLQTQYLTIYKYNQILLMLDSDFNVTFNDYFSTLNLSPGANLRNSVDSLAAKLDTDTGVNNTTFVSSLGGGITFVNIQTDFNIIVNILNTASGTHFKNYQESSSTVTFEALVIEKIKNSNTVVLKYINPLVEGDIISYRGIKSLFIWAPQTFGDASVYKQVNEGTFLFEDTVFYAAEVSYASDLSPEFELIAFNESGLGDWDLFVWDRQNWGGGGSQVPLRTYIPRNKQKCRFLRPSFNHFIAREKYSLFGLSLSFRAFSNRAYKE